MEDIAKEERVSPVIISPSDSESYFYSPTGDQERHDEGSSSKPATPNRNNKFIVYFFILRFVVVVAAVPLALINNNHKSNNISAAEMEAILRETTSKVSQALEQDESPQAQALAWLVEESEVPLQTKNQVIQRFAIAVLVHAMSSRPESDKTTPLIINPLQSECEWIGVVCDEPTNQRRDLMTTSDTADDPDVDDAAGAPPVITKIVWADFGLTGEIPPEVGHLQHLKYLDLAENNLEGSLPDQLFELTSLTHLYLHKNKLTGSLSESFSNLEKLEHFYGGNNKFTGKFPRGLGSKKTGYSDARPLRK